MESEWIDGLLEYPEWFGILCRYSLPMDEPAAPGRGSRRVQEVHHYADLFWNRKKYPRELEQYQKLAVLTALKAVESPRWTKYAQLVGQEDEEWLRLAAVGCKPHGRDVNG